MSNHSLRTTNDRFYHSGEIAQDDFDTPDLFGRHACPLHQLNGARVRLGTIDPQHYLHVGLDGALQQRT